MKSENDPKTLTLWQNIPQRNARSGSRFTIGKAYGYAETGIAYGGADAISRYLPHIHYAIWHRITKEEEQWKSLNGNTGTGFVPSFW